MFHVQTATMGKRGAKRSFLSKGTVLVDLTNVAIFSVSTSWKSHHSIGWSQGSKRSHQTALTRKHRFRPQQCRGPQQYWLHCTLAETKLTQSTLERNILSNSLASLITFSHVARITAFFITADPGSIFLQTSAKSYISFHKCAIACHGEFYHNCKMHYW